MVEELEAKMSSLQRTVKGLIAHCATLQKIRNWRGMDGDTGGWRWIQGDRGGYRGMEKTKKNRAVKLTKPEKVVRCEITLNVSFMNLN